MSILKAPPPHLAAYPARTEQVDVTQQRIGELIGTTRQRVNQVINHWQTEGLIRLEERTSSFSMKTVCGNMSTWPRQGALMSAALKGSPMAQRHLIDTYLKADAERRQEIADECEHWEEIRNKLVEEGLLPNEVFTELFEKHRWTKNFADFKNFGVLEDTLPCRFA